MKLYEIMTTKVVTIESSEPAEEAWARMREHRIRHLVVTENGRLVGMVSDRDLGGKNGKDVRRNRSVGDLMISNVVTADPEMTLREAVNLMRGSLIGSLPVEDDGKIVGIVTATDVLNELGRGVTRQLLRTQRHTLRAPPSDRRAQPRGRLRG